jgi:hypothetical protein
MARQAPPHSPKILNVSWGRTEVEGLGVVKDVKLWPGGGREWDWRETGTEHLPGIQPGDVQELVDHGAEVIVLSKGMELRLHTCPETLDLLGALAIANRAVQHMPDVPIWRDPPRPTAVIRRWRSACTLC